MKRMRMARILIIPMCCGLIACTPNATGPANKAELSPKQSEMRGTSLPTLAPMLKQVSAAVVNISVEGTVEVSPNPLLQDPTFRRFFHLPANQTPLTERVHSVGSG